MARTVRGHWITDESSGLSRRDRRSCDYEAYVPDPLDGRPIALDGDTAAEIAEAERAIATLDAGASALVDTEALARLLLRAECVASSRIEGLEVGARRLLRAAAAVDLGQPSTDVMALEVLGNINAMSSAIQGIPLGEPITVATLLNFHRALLIHTRLARHAGVIRTEQNWIGGSSYSPCSAAFVPPPPDHVPELLEDLCRFCSNDALPAVAQAAIAHAQFDTIHPFADGNGRTGRALIHLILRSRGIATRVLPPVSLVLATWADDYVDGLEATRYRGSATSRAAHDGLNLWVARFAAAARRAVADATSFEAVAESLQRDWRSAVGSVRQNSAVDRLLRVLPGAPLLTVQSARQLTGRSFPAANGAIARLVAAGILRQVSVGRRNRAFEATAVIDAFTDLERQLASPRGDTPDERSVPQGAAPPGTGRRQQSLTGTEPRP
jgi:Fic family protein